MTRSSIASAPRAVVAASALAAGLRLLMAGPARRGRSPEQRSGRRADQLGARRRRRFRLDRRNHLPTDPTDCDGSHGAFPGPYYASVWFSYTTSAGQLNLSAPTMQNDPASSSRSRSCTSRPRRG